MALASELVRDTEVVVLAIGEPSTDQAGAAARLGVKLRSERLKLEWMTEPEADVARTRALVGEMAAAEGVDVVHASQFAAACLNGGVPVVLTLHSDVLSWRRWTLGNSGTPPEWLAYRTLAQSALTRASAVVAVSRFLAREVADLYRPSRSIPVIYNGWPAHVPARRQPRTGTLLAGRVWDAAKNIPLAAAATAGWDPGDVLLAGQLVAPESGVQVTVPEPLRPLGHLSHDELRERLDSAAIYLSPARYDPFGLLPLQAALHECALLLSDIPSYRELWDGAACFFRSDDASDLAACWQSLLANADRRQHLACTARRRAERRFSVRHMADAYRAVYAELSLRRAA